MRSSKKSTSTVTSSAAASDTSPITKEVIAAHGLTHDEYERVVDILKRTPNLVELGIFSVMWSEHCSYKTTRKWLRQFPVTGPQVICGPGENAGREWSDGGTSHCSGHA